MTGTINNGERLDVAFSFYTGPAGVLRADSGPTATIAVRIPPVRGAYDIGGTVAGQPVELISVKKSAIRDFVLVEVRFVDVSADEPE